MKPNHKIALLVSLPFAGLLLILAILSVYLFFENSSLSENLRNNVSTVNSLNSQLADAHTEISELNSDLQSTSNELAETKFILSNTSEELDKTRDALLQASSELNDTHLQLEEATELLDETKTEFLQLKTELYGIEESINDSVQWFSDNAFLPSIPLLNGFFSRTTSKCIENNQLNMGCVPFVMEDRLNFRYLFENPDRLYSIIDMVDHEGGDCEDFSLFFKAYLNTLRKDYPDIKLEAWDRSPGEQYVVYEKSGTSWYYEATPHDLGSLDDFTPYVICYNTAYYDGINRQGHCIVALSRNELLTGNDMTKLNGAPAFEPQNGMFMGTVGTNFYICAEGETGCDNDLNSIVFVISDDDLYQFIDSKWRYYKDYQRTTSEMRMNIDNMIETLD
ncbi:hypothetical protein KKF81_06360 [Candidatus Micrarchaeota archaeon]|nr:hypothetical protein [Candidatus Micrarchaeota archaeon]